MSRIDFRKENSFFRYIYMPTSSQCWANVIQPTLGQCWANIGPMEYNMNILLVNYEFLAYNS